MQNILSLIFMKFFCSTILTLIFFSSLIHAKSRLGEYYYGFGYSMLDGGKNGADVEGDELSLSLNSPASDFADFEIYLEYASVEVGAQDDTAWTLGIDYLRRFDDMGIGNDMIRPFLGAGIGYLKDKAKARLKEDGMTWSIRGGAEILLNDQFSVSLGGRLLGAWTDFSETDFSFDLGVTWWVDEVHGVAFEYSYLTENEIDFIGLKYLYSWQ